MRNESETRAELIDPHLQQQGWAIVPESRIRREYPITKGRLIGSGKRAMPDKADYILQFNNRNVAVLEAKAEGCYYTEGLAQAKDYASRLNLRYAICTNGVKYYMADLQGHEGDITEVPTPEQLWEKLYGEEQKKNQEAFNWEQRFFNVPFETKGGSWELRYYQQNAINKVLKAVANDQKKILITLATGTGKTAVSFQIAWKLFQAKWNINKDGIRSPRILFLADRNILADQAFNAFGAFEDDALKRIKPSEIKKEGKVPTNGSIFFTIFQTFMSGEEPNFGQYPKDFFDFIIVDECHRGGANDESTWRAILEYFEPATQLGLTATPKRDVNGDTYKYFGEPVSVYSLKEGINDGYLTPFRVKQIQTNIDEYQFTSDDDVISGMVEEGREYTESDFNRIITIKAREEYRVKEFLKMINQNQKTLVFCATQDHALAVRDLINQHCDSKNPNYCQRVTANDGEIGEKHLRDFQDNEKSIPTILTTSQKLSTGVDAPEIRNIVLMRPVNSMIEFKQIVGRGTRLFEGKDYFTIYDFVKAYKHFNDPAWDGEPLEPEPKEPRGPLKECSVCGQKPCICPKPDKEPCEMCGYIDCRCDNQKEIIEVVLSDGKVRQLQSMTTTTFWSPEGKPITATEFLKSLYGTIPDLFQSEEDLKTQWSTPATRKSLLGKLEEKGYTKEQLSEFQKILSAENSDIYDVLSYVAYQSEILEREQRAAKMREHFKELNANHQEFLEFVLNQYILNGVYELDDEKLGTFLQLKYKTIADAKPILGDLKTIRNNFIEYQKYLYV
ncbi:EcoAI/FtnUII family type I restriction enzme subunit R [Flavobacterium haoranii]|uniref:Type I restriction enzyme, R subunit n=1 Tax=Flavobacterium haoranii TaxID=683124 RepID=A0A1M6LS92_9FLAO|nr:type I restriction endonuclease subunit R [Flavobacterium haoranii]SHJ74104.1 type I restriction enzyme, R subunit [Flavobacterium haoranii]